MCPCCVSQVSALLALHVSQINMASHLHPSTSWVSSSKRSLEFSELMFFGRTRKEMSFSLFDSLVVMFAFVPAASCAFAFTFNFFVFFLLPPSHLSLLLLLLFSCSYDFTSFSSIFLSHTQWYIALNVTIMISASAFTSRSFNFF